MPPVIVTRAEWNPRYGRGRPTSGPKMFAIVHHDGHTRSKRTMSLEAEKDLARFYESFHVHGDKPGSFAGLTGQNGVEHARIGYSWLIMQSGRAFEGCGWGRIGAHTENMNSSGYGFFFPLDGDRDAPTPEALATFEWLRAEGVRLGHLHAHHYVKGHQDYNKPACPGELVYNAAVLGCAPINASAGLEVVPAVDLIRARPTLRLGKGGKSNPPAEADLVRELQLALISEKFMTPTLANGLSSATGFFGPATETAVRQYQRAKGLEADGVVGAATWEALSS